MNTAPTYFAFVNAYAPVNDITVACGGGAIAMGFPVIHKRHGRYRGAVQKSLIIQQNTKDFIDTRPLKRAT
jgi:acetyl-CoA synthase